MESFFRVIMSFFNVGRYLDNKTGVYLGHIRHIDTRKS